MLNQNTLLLVGGTNESCTALHDILDAKYHLLQTSDLEQAKQVLVQYPIAVVLLDITDLKNADIDDIHTWIQSPDAANIPFLALTFCPNEKISEQLITIGISDIVIMPCFAALLLRRIQIMIEWKSQKLQVAYAQQEQVSEMTAQNQSKKSQPEHEKYYEILCHMNLAVFEIDVDCATYQVIYNTDSNLYALDTISSYQDLISYATEHLILPKEQEMLLAAFYKGMKHLFEDRIRQEDFYIHFKNVAGGDPILYRLTMFRVRTLDTSGKRITIICQKILDQKSMQRDADFLNDAIWETSDRICSVYEDKNLTFRRVGKDILSLLGYTIAELQTQYHNHMIALIHPEDRQNVWDTMKEQLAEKVEFVMEFRIRHKDGHYIWVLSQSYHFDVNEEEAYLYFVLIDISKSKATEEMLQQTMEHQAIILEQTESVIFEYDVILQKAVFSPRWKQIFGYEPINSNIIERMPTETHFHPDDISIALHVFEALMNGSPYEECDLRVAKDDGEYLWCSARITVQYSLDKKPLKFIGVITNIDAQKRTEKTLQERAEKDSLTELLNKSASRSYIEEYLLNAPDDTQSAFIVIDLDNFKQVNDLYGHLMGDIIIKQAATEIKNMFRSNDIVARIGGDEFIVVMKTVPSKEILEKRLGALIEIFYQKLHEQVPDAQLGCSIGVAIFPEHGIVYQDLFRHADQALYQAKTQGKNKYVIYDVTHIALPQCKNKTQRQCEQAQSNQEDEVAIEHLLQYTFQQLYESGDVEQTVQIMLEVVGRTLNVSRVYIFENNADNTCCSNTFEWCNDGIEPAMEHLQNISYEDELLGYEDNFNEYGIFYCPDIAKLPKAQYDILAPQGIKSMLQCSIRDRGVFRGYVGFDECTENRLWVQKQIDALTFFSEMLSIFLLKKRAQDEIAYRVQNLYSILENQKAWIYVIDVDTYEILFMNAKTKVAAPGAEEGKYCYECLMGLDSCCPECPTRNINEQGNGEQYIYNKKLGIHSYAEATLIHWNGKDAYLILCHEVKKS